jgi:hypothetical protein
MKMVNDTFRPMTVPEWDTCYETCGEIMEKADFNAIATFFIATANETARVLLS